VESLEKIDTNLDEYGIVFVMSSQLDKARQVANLIKMWQHWQHGNLAALAAWQHWP
jgi:hypothetical protein